jgi:large subunit ribosomal protein L4
MTVQKLLTYNILNKNEQVPTQECTLELKVLENSGNYVIHKDIVRHAILKKQGTSSTKTRSEVRGGGRKPWRQKGTGRARAGSNRSPLWRGGGVIFGPKPKIIKIKLNKKERNLALQTLLYNHRNDISIVNEDILNVNKTKELLTVFNEHQISLTKKTLIVVSKKPKKLYLASRNIKNVDLILASNLNTLSLLKSEQIIMTLPVLKIISEVYCG